jgi:hypothetical protein
MKFADVVILDIAYSFNHWGLPLENYEINLSSLINPSLAHVSP